MRQLKLLLVSLGFLGVLVVPGLAHADVNDFTVTSFAAEETLTRADRQGELHVIERINVDFTDNNHGLLRAIPGRYKSHSLQLHVDSVSSDTGAPARYTTSGSNGNTVLKIGDANRTVTGAQEYTIEYTLRNVISFYPDHDELYWDVNGDQWQQEFRQAAVTLHLPDDLRQTKAPRCYTGDYGSRASDCTVSTNDHTLQSTTTEPLTAGQTLTYVAGFDKGYFQPSSWYETLGEYWRQIAGVALPLLAIGGGSALYWWRRGRDPRGSGIIVPQYDAPDGLKPLAVGGLIDFRVDNRDITATVIDLAIRGYLKIIETKQGKLIGKDKLAYTLELTNDRLDDLDPQEKAILSALFDQQLAVGRQVNLSDGKVNFAATAATIKTQVKNRLKTDGYLRAAPLKTGRARHFIVRGLVIVVAAGAALAIAQTAFVIGCVIGVLVALPFQFALDARTAKGVAAKEHIVGLKLYLEVAEKDRLAKLQAPDAPYAAGATEPVKTVDLYEKLLPYAMVLGVEQQWSKQFAGLYTAPPDWYNGNWTTFNALYLASSLDDGIGSAVNSAFTAPSSSASSGFGGGGFSGGGGGGGGGGGW